MRLNWRRPLLLTALALMVGVASALYGLESSGASQVLLLTLGAVALFLFFTGIYVTLVRRYYYRQ